METIPVVAELFRSYGRTGGNDKINRHFRKFCKGPYKIRSRVYRSSVIGNKLVTLFRNLREEKYDIFLFILHPPPGNVP